MLTRCCLGKVNFRDKIKPSLQHVRFRIRMLPVLVSFRGRKNLNHALFSTSWGSKQTFPTSIHDLFRWESPQYLYSYVSENVSSSEIVTSTYCMYWCTVLVPVSISCGYLVEAITFRHSDAASSCGVFATKGCGIWLLNSLSTYLEGTLWRPLFSALPLQHLQICQRRADFLQYLKTANFCCNALQ